jgi:hypothetical protein
MKDHEVVGNSSQEDLPFPDKKPALTSPMESLKIEVNSSVVAIDSKEISHVVKGTVIALADTAERYFDCPPTAIKTVKAFTEFMRGVEKLPDLPSELWVNALRCAFEMLRIVTDHQEALKKESAKKAANVRHAENRELAERAKSVAADLWREGSELLHHKMKVYLAGEYKDSTGVNPFKTLPDKPFLTACREAAEMIERPDLIFGKQPTVRKK